MSKFVDNIMSDKSFLSELAIQQISIDQILPDPAQVRQNFDQERLKELADSIKEKGIQNPIHVHVVDDKFVIITGERRFRAAQIAELVHLPCIVHKESLDQKEITTLQLIENLQRQDLGVIETAKGFDALLQHGMSQREISRSLGISEANISKYCKVIKLPKTWLTQLEDIYKKGINVPIKEIYNVAKETNRNKQKALYQKLLDDCANGIQCTEEEPETEIEPTTERVENSPEVDLEKVWEALKKAMRKDKSELLKYLSGKKIEKLLLDYGDKE